MEKAAAGAHYQEKDNIGEKGEHYAHEAPEINALLLAHRARTPVALGVSEDYADMPWQLPRSFIVLGWFWITDAWLEPVLNEKVRWRFRFDWCKIGQLARPWWETVGGSLPCLYEQHLSTGSAGKSAKDDAAWTVDGPNQSATESVKMPDAQGREPQMTDLEKSVWKQCHACGAASLDVYVLKGFCLNETCPEFFVEPDDPGEWFWRGADMQTKR